MTLSIELATVVIVVILINIWRWQLKTFDQSIVAIRRKTKGSYHNCFEGLFPARVCRSYILCGFSFHRLRFPSVSPSSPSLVFSINQKLCWKSSCKKSHEGHLEDWCLGDICSVLVQGPEDILGESRFGLVYQEKMSNSHWQRRPCFSFLGVQRKRVTQFILPIYIDYLCVYPSWFRPRFINIFVRICMCSVESD